MAVFSNQELSAYCKRVDDYAKQLQKDLYAQYKLAYSMVQSPNFRGQAANAYKEYIDKAAIYFLNRILDLSRDLQNLCQDFKKAFLQVEPDAEGVVSDAVLALVSREMTDKRRDFDALINNVYNIHARAGHLVSLQVDPSGVTTDYVSADKHFSELAQKTVDTDRDMSAQVSAFCQAIETLRKSMTEALTLCYDGIRLNAFNVKTIDKQDWYKPSNGDVLLEQWSDDPFVYSYKQGAVWEDQWAVGIDEEEYAMMGASVLSGNMFYSKEDGIYMVNIGGSVLSGELFAKNDYISSRAAIDVLKGEVGAKFGWTDDYKGFDVFAEAVSAQLESSIVFGKGYVEVDGAIKGPSANAFATWEFIDENNYTIGAGAEASVVNAGIGVGLVNVPTTRGGTTNLFGASFSVDAYAVGASVRESSVNVVDTNVIDINVTTVDLGIDLGIGGSLSVTLPTIRVEPPWEWFK